MVGSFYRQPEVTSSLFTELNEILQSAFKSNGKTVILGGDFNTRGIDWESQTLTDTCNHPGLCEDLIDLANNNGLAQLQRTPTREQSILDLYFTNKPSLVKCHETVPGISDHHMVVVDSDIAPTVNRKQPRKVHSFTKVDWEKARRCSAEFTRSHLPTIEQRTVQENWNSFTDHINKIIHDHVPSRTLSGKHHLPWINKSEETN